MLGPPKPRRLDEPIAVSLEDLVPPNHFYRHLEAKLDLELRPRLDAGALRRARPAQHRPGRLLQAPAGHVLRGDPLRAAAHRDGQPQPGPPLVPRLRPGRGPARPLQPDPHPPAPGHRRLPALLRAGRRALPGGRPGLGPGALLRCHEGRGQRRPRLAGPALLLRGQAHVATSSRDDAPQEHAMPTPTCRWPAARFRWMPAQGQCPEEPEATRGNCWRSGGSILHRPSHRGYQRTSDFSGQHDRPRRHARCGRPARPPGLPRPLRRRRRQAPHHPGGPGHAGRRDGEPADAGPAVAGPLPAQAPAPPGHRATPPTARSRTSSPSRTPASAPTSPCPT